MKALFYGCLAAIEQQAVDALFTRCIKTFKFLTSKGLVYYMEDDDAEILFGLYDFGGRLVEAKAACIHSYYYNTIIAEMGGTIFIYASNDGSVCEVDSEKYSIDGAIDYLEKHDNWPI
jgi:hypothetical protein